MFSLFTGLFFWKRELEEARKELQLELDKGVTIDEIRKKVTKGDVQAKVVKKPFVPERIQRKDRDVTQLLNKPEPGFRSILIEQGTLTALEKWSREKEGQEGVNIINKKLFKTGDHRVLVRSIRILSYLACFLLWSS